AELRREIVDRRPGGNRRRDSAFTILPIVSVLLSVLTIGWLFFRLLYRRRIDFANSLRLAAVSYAATLAGTVTATSWQEGIGSAGSAILVFLCIVPAWSAGESFLRSVRPGFTTSLDLLRARRLGPRGGRA